MVRARVRAGARVRGRFCARDPKILYVHMYDVDVASALLENAT